MSRATYRWLEAGTLAASLGLAAYLRLANLRDNPGWFSDEGTHLNIAQHWLRGEVRYFALNQSTLLAARLPLFDWILAGLLRLGGEPMTTLRAFTALCGVLSVAALYCFARRASGQPALALLSALMLAICPPAVLYSRFGFSYNLLALSVVAGAVGLEAYLRSGRRGPLALAALLLGLGTLSDLLGLAFIAVPGMVALKRRPRDAAWSVPLALTPFGGYVLANLLTVPPAFFFDARYTFLRVNNLTLPQQLLTLADNYAVLLTQEPWILSGLAGLFTMRPARLKWLSLLMWTLPVTVIGRSAALYSLGEHYLIVAWPFIALGVAALVHFGVSMFWRKITTQSRKDARGIWSRASVIAASLVAAIPFSMSAAQTIEQVNAGFVTAVDPFLIHPEDARRAANFVNRAARDDDVVIASPAIAWLIRANANDFVLSAAAEREATVYFPTDIPLERFAFDARWSRARFAIVDNLWRNWAAPNMPAVVERLRTVEAWPLAVQFGEIRVHRNPFP